MREIVSVTTALGWTKFCNFLERNGRPPAGPKDEGGPKDGVTPLVTDPRLVPPLQLVNITRLGTLAASMLRTGCTTNRLFQTVETENLTKKFYKNNFCALLGEGPYIKKKILEIKEQNLFFFVNF